MSDYSAKAAFNCANKQLHATWEKSREASLCLSSTGTPFTALNEVVTMTPEQRTKITRKDLERHFSSLIIAMTQAQCSVERAQTALAEGDVQMREAVKTYTDSQRLFGQAMLLGDQVITKSRKAHAAIEEQAAKQKASVVIVQENLRATQGTLQTMTTRTKLQQELATVASKNLNEAIDDYVGISIAKVIIVAGGAFSGAWLGGACAAGIGAIGGLYVYQMGVKGIASAIHESCF